MVSNFWLIVGLGNPGATYEATRHNMGFMVADTLAQRWSITYSDHKGIADLGKGSIQMHGNTVKVFLAKPLTFMNCSGQAVASISAYYQIQPDHILVVHDDMDLAFQRMKIKIGGSSGGHNGIRSIDRSLNTTQYARVRMGIGRPERANNAHHQTVDWVLSRFTSQQRVQLPEVLARGADAVETVIIDGLTKAQEQFHGC